MAKRIIAVVYVPQEDEYVYDPDLKCFFFKPF
jgi:hypothetical protein